MSYRILYQAQFVKVDEQFIPLILQGDNNTWDTRSSRRARDWQVSKWLCSAYPFTTPDHITQALISEREELIRSNAEMLQKYPNWGEYEDTCWGYYSSVAIDPLHTSQTSFQAIQEFYANAFTNARPLEETSPLILQAGYRIEQKCKQEGLSVPQPQYVHTTTELLDSIRAWQNQWQDNFLIYSSKSSTPR